MENYLNDVSEILKGEKMDLGRHNPLRGEEIEILKKFCISNGFVIEDFVKVSKRRYHFTKLNVYMIYSGYAVIENFRHIQRGRRKWFTQRRNYFVVWVENNELKWKPISGQLYMKMRRDFLHKRNPIERFLKWSESGKSVEVWDFPATENYSIRRII